MPTDLPWRKEPGAREFGDGAEFCEQLAETLEARIP